MAPGETRPHCKLGGVFASSYTCLAVIPSLWFWYLRGCQWHRFFYDYKRMRTLKELYFDAYCFVVIPVVDMHLNPVRF